RSVLAQMRRQISQDGRGRQRNQWFGATRAARRPAATLGNDGPRSEHARQNGGHADERGISRAISHGYFRPATRRPISTAWKPDSLNAWMMNTPKPCL